MPTSVAVIVTYNRKELLARCIRTILEGELVPDEVMVVDNASTDGTIPYIREQFPARVSILPLPKNAGGAGGFKAGFKEAVDRGFDFLWVMDDDHQVDRNAFRVLMTMMEKLGADVAGPAILSEAKDGKLAWEIGPPGGTKYGAYIALQAAYAKTGYMDKLPDAFNAVVYRRALVEKLGLPDDRLFIRGDEVEYSMRMERAQVRAIVATEAKVYHPTAANDKCSVITVGGKSLTAYYTGNKLKDYCIARNRAFYYKKYGQWKTVLLDAPRYTIFFLLTRKFDWAGFKLWLQGYRDGLSGSFGGERQFIR